MKTKQLIVSAIGILVLGIMLGWLIFGGKSSNDEQSETNAIDQIEEVWTCSMHPQIRQPEPGDCPICGMDLIPLESRSNSNPLVFEMSEDAVKIANIQTTQIGVEAVNGKGLKLSGKIKPNETQSASIVSHLGGRIERLFVSYTGESVGKGQKIASIYSPKLITAQKELIEAHKVKATSPKLYVATVNKLKFWKISDAQIQSIIDSENIIETFNIYANFSGVILHKRVSVGDYIKEGEVLFDVQNLNQLWAVFDVYENDLPSVKVGKKISFTTSSIPNKTFTSTINFVEPIINPSTRTAKIRANINNSNHLLKPEMFIEGVMSTENSSNESLLVPKSAVMWTGEKSVVYVKLPSMSIPSFEFREVTLGRSSGNNYFVLDGLSNGDEVVTNGAFVIDASAQLNNQSSMMNRKVLSTQIVSLPDYVSKTSAEFKSQLGIVLENYLELKDALVKSNVKESSTAANSLVSSLDKVDMKLLKGKPHMYWMKQLKLIRSNGIKIKESTHLTEQRDAFKTLSDIVISTAKSFGVSHGKFYVQFCPMAENDKGAYWLSKAVEIRNPYFGDEMLTCGSIKDTLDKNYQKKSKIESNKSRSMNGHNH